MSDWSSSLRRRSRSLLCLGALALPALGGCALFFPQQNPNSANATSSANAQANRADNLEKMRVEARSGGPNAQLQWAAYLSGILGSPDAKASFGEGIAWPELEVEAIAMMDALASGEDAQLALQASGVQAQLLLATGKSAEAVAVFQELHAAAPSFDTAVSVLLISAQTGQALDDPVSFCREQRGLAISDEQLYGFMNACLQANQAAGGSAELSAGLPWATKKDFNIYARVDAAMIAERQRQAAAQEEARQAEAARQERERERAAASAASAPSRGAASSSAPASPAVVSVTLRNRCHETVKLFFGDKPKFGSGTYSSLGGNSSTSKQFREGDMIWVVDDGQNGLSSTTVSRGARTIEITESCTGMTTR